MFFAVMTGVSLLDASAQQQPEKPDLNVMDEEEADKLQKLLTLKIGRCSMSIPPSRPIMQPFSLSSRICRRRKSPILRYTRRHRISSGTV